jgi:hypothetical protein
MANNKYAFIFPVAVVILVILVLIIPLDKKPPLGIPADYYDIINHIESEEANVYVISETINFNDDYQSINITNPYSIPMSLSTNPKFVVIDMNTYNNFDIDYDEYISELYNDYCYNIIIVNYEYSNSLKLKNLVEASDAESNLITLSFLSCGGDPYKSINSSDFPSELFLQYAILHKISSLINQGYSE